MSFDKATYEQRKKLHICVDCSKPVDYPDKYVRCKACRDNHTKLSRNWREKNRPPAPEHPLKEQALKEQAKKEKAMKDKAMKEAAEKAIQAAKNQRKANKCARCEWATFTGTSFVCMFPEGACMK